MSAEDTMKLADAERQKAQDLQAQAEHTLENARQQADGMQRQADDHMGRAQQLDAKAREEQRQEAEKLAENAREDQKKQDQRNSFLGF